MDFKLPDIGEGVHEGEITKWLVQPGQSIQADQPMVEVMTDKATVEIPSPVAGVVEQLFAKEGETVEVGKALLRIQEKGKEAAAPTKPVAPSKPSNGGNGGGNGGGKEHVSATPSPTVRPAAPVMHTGTTEVVSSNILATPATRKLARDLQIPLAGVNGTGPHGRVTKMDVQMAYENQQAQVKRPSHPAPTSTAISTKSTPVTARSSTQAVPVVPRGEIQRIPLKGIRKRIAESMAHSKRTAAHFTYVEEVDMTEIVSLRKSAGDEAAKRNVKLTFLPFIIKALVPTLAEFPYLNSSLDDEKQEIILKGDYNIGIATDTQNGLIVPVIKAADRKTVWELAQDISELSEKARTGKLALEDLKGGTFTVTNAGSIGGVFATPIINYPEVAILGVNAIRKRPVVKDDQIVIRDMMYLSLSVDHRIVDGADAARFMNRLVYFLNVPMRLVFV
jgi:pyruvate dehydrogenase E2 component (dihydrolipoamide acetyltransferase)